MVLGGMKQLCTSMLWVVVIQTKFIGSSMFADERIGWVKSAASDEVGAFGSVYQAVATIPEIKEVEHLPYV